MDQPSGWTTLLISAVLSAVLGTAGGFWASRANSDYEALLARRDQFIGQQKAMLDIAKDFIDIASNNEGIKASKSALANSVLAQKIDAESLRLMYRGKAEWALDNYIRDLTNLHSAILDYESPADYGKWRSAFGAATDGRDRVVSALSSS